MKLILQGYHLHPFKNHLACAYIYYERNKRIVDQCNNPIESLSKKQFAEWNNYLLNVIRPMVNPMLNKDKYICTHTENMKRSPHPALLIQRTDNKDLSNDDISKIHKLLMQGLSKITLVRFDLDDKNALQKNSLFKDENKQPPQGDKRNTPTQHGYNLRQRS